MEPKQTSITNSVSNNVTPATAQRLGTPDKVVPVPRPKKAKAKKK